MAYASFDTILRDYTESLYKEVDAPEFPDREGTPQTFRFRTKLTVADYLWMLDRPTDLQPELQWVDLFYLLAVDESGEPLVPRQGMKHYERWLDAVNVSKIATVVLRAELPNLVYAEIYTEERAELEKKNRARPVEAQNRKTSIEDILYVARFQQSRLKGDGTPPKSEDGDSETS